MFDWWDVLSSVTRVNAWAQYFTVFFLMLGAASMVISLKTSGRIAKLKDLQGIHADAGAPPKAEAKPEARPAAPGKPAAAQPKAAEAPKPPAGRHLSQDEKSKLAALLAGRPKGSVSITYVANDSEAQAYSQDLAKVLAAAGWKVTETGPTADPSNPKGLHFQIKNVQNEPENAKYLIHSFIEVGFKPVTELNKAVPEATLMLVVGHKA